MIRFRKEEKLNFTVMTQASGWLKPFAKILGWIFELIYRFFAHFGIANVGVVIIVFVLFVKILMLPLTFKQQKFSKMNTIMQPELEKIRKKYDGKKDQETMEAMNRETQEVYQKYGVSPTGGCLNMLIQIPIMFALYRVVMNVPAYVPQIKTYYTNIIDKIGVDTLKADSTLLEVGKKSALNFDKVSGKTEITNRVIDILYKFNTDNWDALKKSYSAAENVINKNVASIDKVNSFLGMNLTQSPKAMFHDKPYVIIIPLLAGLSQFISSKVTMADTNTGSDSENPMAASMKSMTYTMPLISIWMCYSFATCIGLYWILSSIFSMFAMIIVNKYFEKIPMDQMIEESRKKAQARREKLGIDDETIKKAASINSKKMNSIENKSNQTKKNNNANQAQKNVNDNVQKITNAKKGSIAEKNNIVDKYK